jgi:hypothetical protein
MVRNLHRWRDNLFEAATSLGWACVGLAYLTAPGAAGRSPVGHSVHPWDVIWSVLYVVGGPMVYWALGDPRRVPWRVAGLTLLATGLVMQAIAVAVLAPDTRVGLYLIYAIACALRAVLCSRVISAGRQTR